MVVSDDGFEPYWTDETDRVVEFIGLPDYLPDDDTVERLNWIGRVAAFAAHTNTRLLSQVGDPDNGHNTSIFGDSQRRMRCTFLRRNLYIQTCEV